MSEPLDDLIEKLAADGRRVRRLAPPMTRAMLWLGAVLLVSALSVWSIADLPLFMSRIEDAKLRLELAGTALTGIAAIVAAFHLSLPRPDDGLGLAAGAAAGAVDRVQWLQLLAALDPLRSRRVELGRER